MSEKKLLEDLIENQIEVISNCDNKHLNFELYGLKKLATKYEAKFGHKYQTDTLAKAMNKVNGYKNGNV